MFILLINKKRAITSHYCNDMTLKFIFENKKSATSVEITDIIYILFFII